MWWWQALVVAGTRDYSLQRRNQKLVEEVPAPFFTDEQRHKIHDAAAAIYREVGIQVLERLNFCWAPMYHHFSGSEYQASG